MAAWQLPDPKQVPSLDKYALESAHAYGYSKLYADMMSYLGNQEEILKTALEADATTDTE